MERLSSVQREVIQRSYLDNEGEFDYISCGEMGISDSTFRRLKNEAISILAAALGLEVAESTELSQEFVCYQKRRTELAVLLFLILISFG